MKNPVFCKECKHLVEKKTIDYGASVMGPNIVYSTFYQCHAPENYKDNLTYFKATRYRRSYPSKINKRNNCKWFKGKEEGRLQKYLSNNKNNYPSEKIGPEDEDLANE